MYILRNLNVVREVRRERSRHRDGERRKRTVCRVADVVPDVRDLSQCIGESLARRIADRFKTGREAFSKRKVNTRSNGASGERSRSTA